MKVLSNFNEYHESYSALEQKLSNLKSDKGQNNIVSLNYVIALSECYMNLQRIDFFEQAHNLQSSINKSKKLLNTLVSNYISQLKHTTTIVRQEHSKKILNSKHSNELQNFFKSIDISTPTNNFTDLFENELQKFLYRNPYFFQETKPDLEFDDIRIKYVNNLIQIVQDSFLSAPEPSTDQEELSRCVEQQLCVFQEFNSSIDDQGNQLIQNEDQIFNRLITKKHFYISMSQAYRILTGWVHSLYFSNSLDDFIEGPGFVLRESKESLYQDSYEEYPMWSNQPVVIVTWNNDLTSLFLAAHEIGHAFFDLRSQKSNSQMDKDLLEVPSSLFEHYLAEYLLGARSPFDASQKILVKEHYKNLFIDRIFGQSLFNKFQLELIEHSNDHQFQRFAFSEWHKERQMYFGKHISIKMIDYHWLISPQLIRYKQSYKYLKSWLISIDLLRKKIVPNVFNITNATNTNSQLVTSAMYFWKNSALIND